MLPYLSTLRLRASHSQPIRLPISGYRIGQVFVLVFILTALSWGGFKNLTEAYGRSQWFELTGDEALHTELINQLATTGHYQDGALNPFAPHLTTGPSVIVPAALLTKLFSIPAPVSGRLVVLGFHFALLLLLAKWARLKIERKAGRYVYSGSLALRLVLVLSTLHLGWRGFQDAGYYLYGIMGEGPGLYFVMASLFALSRGRTIQTGIYGALAVFCKPFYLTYLTVVFCILIFRWVFFRNHSFRFVVGASLGAVLVFAAWHLFLSMQEGPHFALQYWLNYPSVMRATNGAGMPSQWSSEWVFSQMTYKIKHLSELFTRPRSAFIAIGAFTYCAILAFSPKVYESILAKVSGTFILAHSVWWLILSPGAEARYLFPAVAVAWSLLSMWIAQAAVPYFFSPHLYDSNIVFKVFRRLATLLSSTLILFFLIHTALNPLARVTDRPLKIDQCDFCVQMELASAWASLKNIPIKELHTLDPTYALDRDLLWSMPLPPSLKRINSEPFRSNQNLKSSAPQAQDLPKGDWVIGLRSLKDLKKVHIARYLSEHCQKRAPLKPPFDPSEVSLNLLGFWTCR